MQYLVEYNGDTGHWLGVHEDGLQLYHVIYFTTGSYTGQEMLCYDIPALKWTGKKPVEMQTVAFADTLDKYNLF